MKLKVKYYGQLIDLVNKEEETININGKTINCLNTKILKLYPILNGFTFSIAQNNELNGEIIIYPKEKPVN